MLIQFTVENHRSIKNSAVISFAASKDKSFEEYLLHPDEKKVLLPVLAIYGANAAGKSNVLPESFHGCGNEAVGRKECGTSGRCLFAGNKSCATERNGLCKKTAD